MAGSRVRRVAALGWALAALSVAMLAAPESVRAQDARARADALASSAVVLARSGDHAEALALYEKAYELDPDPLLLYNIGRVAEKAGRPERAREALRAFLAQATDPELRARAQESLERVTAAPSPAPVPSVAPSTPSPDATSMAAVPLAPRSAANDLAPMPVPAAPVPAPSVSRLPAWGWALIGTGVAVLAGGGVATYLLLRDGGSSADHTWAVR